MYVGVEMSPRLQLFVEDAICIRSSRRCVRNSDSSGQNFLLYEKKPKHHIHLGISSSELLDM